MKTVFFRNLTAAFALCAGVAAAEPQHGIAMYGEPALPPDFVALPYVNPDAPTGGAVISAEVGTFDSLNPYVLKGTVPWQLTFLVTESLMGRTLDEPFTLYGLLAESVETDPERSWVEFTLRAEARFSDGSPVTVEDVIWSYETLGTQGHPRYLTFWEKVASIEATGERSVRITFNTADRELAMLAGMRPILKKSQWDGVDFANSDGLDIIPITSGPYVVQSFEAGRFVELVRDPEAIRDIVSRLTDRMESDSATPWSITDAPDEFTNRLLRSIIGVSMTIDSIEGKAKLNQDDEPADREAVAAWLSASDPVRARLGRAMSDRR